MEYSQPVLYSHFAGKDAIVAAVALEGFAELAAELREARTGTSAPEAALRAVADAYLEFARGRPALYDAMFARPIDLAFGSDSSPGELKDAFGELRTALVPLAEDGDVETLTEVFWGSLHGLVTLSRGRRLRVDHATARLDILVDHVAGLHGSGADPSG